MKKIDVLDHGYVELIEAWGGGRDGSFTERVGVEIEDAVYTEDYEAGIIEAARQSTQGSFRDWERDAKLLTYLYRHKHLTPFEFAGMVIEVQAPIFVFREWHRHRTQSYNEMSARYSPLPDLYYTPTLERVMMGADKNKQAQGVAGARPLTEDCAKAWLKAQDDFNRIAEAQYKIALQNGIPKELARIVMPVGHYSRMRASTNLRNWLAFLTLRLDSAAQWEIREYARAVGRCLEQAFPQTWKLFNEP